MKVGDFVKRDAQTVSPNDSLGDAAELLKRGNLGSLPVVRDDRLIGMLLTEDLPQNLSRSGGALVVTVEDVMRTSGPSCHENDPISEAIAKMQRANLTRIPVLIPGNWTFVGIVTLSELLSAARKSGDDDGDDSAPHR